MLIIAPDSNDTNSTANPNDTNSTSTTSEQETDNSQNLNTTQTEEPFSEEKLFAPIYAVLRRFPNARIEFRLTRESISALQNNGTDLNPWWLFSALIYILLCLNNWYPTNILIKSYSYIKQYSHSVMMNNLIFSIIYYSWIKNYILYILQV